MRGKGPGPDAYRRRLVGLYALTLMDRAGPLHGYGLSEAIAQRTDGQWRPGPGSVYPSLRKLVEHGLARPRTVGRRTQYSITSPGRALLRRIRTRQEIAGRGRADLSALWAEVTGTGDVDAFLLGRLHRTLDAISERLARDSAIDRPAGDLRAETLRELTAALERLTPGRARVPAARGRVRAH